MSYRARFDHSDVPMPVLSQRAFNYRWAEIEPGTIPLTAADPDFPAAIEIRDAICNYAASGVFSYGPHLGLPQFKHELIGKYQRRRYRVLNASQVIPIDSAASGMHVATRALLQPGDEMIIFDPVDFLFEQSARAVGAKVVRFSCQGDALDMDQLASLVTRRTRMIGICNPHNPLGRLLTLNELQQLAQLAAAHDLWLLNDEIWSDIVYSPHSFYSFHHLEPSLQQRVITVYGFSKAYALAGLRIGTIYTTNEILHEKLVGAARLLTTAGGVATLSQIAATAALQHCQYWVDAFVNHLQQQRDRVVARINAIPGLSCDSPQATYVLFARLLDADLSEEWLVDYLRREAKVAIIPGSPAFFGPAAAGHVRLCFATSETLLNEGLNRIEAAMTRLNRCHI